ncbi:MAG: uracil-DNA glycosylase [Rhodocyclaceae bacterium]|jgi:uracil-DNA glycosylase family 4|nr:uracil-DNA glycosylase [Rhodocyclaceae bacterium]
MDRLALLKEMGLSPVWALRRKAEAMPHVAAKTMVAPPEKSTATDLVAGLDWPQLRSAVAACQACGLCHGRTQAVLGVGDTQADWLFVGEGPGAEEDAKGEPFVGQAGKLLDNMLASIGLRRGENVYIANTVKCRPPNNRTPEPAETAACFPYLERQIELIQPRLIVALGKPAAQTLLARETTIAAARGALHAYRDIPLIVTYHPAYLLRNLPDKAKAWEDLVFMRRTMRQLKESRS